MDIKFTASLQGAACIKIDDDHSARVVLTCDGSQIPSVVKLLTMKDKTFTVKIQAE